MVLSVSVYVILPALSSGFRVIFQSSQCFVS